MAVSGNNYIHEMDRKALESLKQIPGFTPLMKGFMKVFNERTFHILNMSGKVRLSETQYPHIYAMLPPICETLGIKEPELYLELNRTPNAYTYGDNDVFITVTSGLLEYMTDDEIRTVLAHECGHIACHHVLYHTMGSFLLSGAASMLGLDGLFTTALQLGFAYWERCSEFSCVAVLEDGTIAGEIAIHETDIVTKDGKVTQLVLAQSAVLPQYRMQGIMRMLVEYALNKARKMGR